MQRRAFTLIELLVVIAIIAILAAILFPVFAQAKAAAKKTVAVSDVKQLALASLMYSTDFDDNYCAEGQAQPSNNWGWQMTWQMETLPYIKNTGIFLAPGDNHKNDRTFDTGPMFSFPGNGVFAGTCSPSWQGWFAVGPIQSSRTWVGNWQNAMSVTSVPLSSETILFATRFKMSPQSWMQGGIDGIYSPWATTLMASDGVDAGNSLPGEKNGMFAAPVPDYNGVIYDGWAGSSPFAFCDGHSKSMKPIQTVNMAAGIANNNAGGCKESGYLKMWDATRTQ